MQCGTQSESQNVRVKGLVSRHHSSTQSTSVPERLSQRHNPRLGVHDFAAAMPDDGLGSELSREQTVLGSNKWRGKLFYKASQLSKGIEKLRKDDGRSSKTDDNGVSDFLHGAEQKPLQKPRIDTTIAPRWPAAVSANLFEESPASTNSRPSTAQSSSSLPVVTQRKRRNAKHLHVTFTKTQPEIIGEGGDEAELPAREVFSSWQDVATEHAAQVFVRTEPESRPPFQALKSPPPFDDDIDFRKPLLRRVQTGADHLSPPLDLELRRRSMEIEEGAAQLHHRKEVGSAISSVVHNEHTQRQTNPVLEPNTPRPPPHRSSPHLRSSSELSQFDPFPPKPASPRRKEVPKPQPNASCSPHDAPSSLTSTPTPQIPDIPTRAPPPDDLHLPPAPSSGSTVGSEHAYWNTLSPFSDNVAQQRPSPTRSVFDDGVTSAKEDESQDEFYSRMQHLRGVFRLAAETSQATAQKATEYWLRASTWWFLKGRSALEASARQSQNRSPRLDSMELPLQNKQSYVDLAKAWWIVEEVIPDGSLGLEKSSQSSAIDAIDGLDPSGIKQVYKSLRASMRALMLSMKKNRLLPPHSLLVQGVDTTIWITYPALPPGLLALVADLDPRSFIKRTSSGYEPFFSIFVGDTERRFSYGRMFVDTEIVSEDETSDDVQFPCILSIIRERTSSDLEITIASQDGQVNLHIQADKRRGPTWSDIHWKIKSHSMRINLTRDLNLTVRFWESDFKTLWGIHDYTRRVDQESRPKDREELVFNDTVTMFQYIPPTGSSGTFPSNPIKHCKVRLFEKRIHISDGSGHRQLHDGYRILVVTPPGVKSLSSLNKSFGLKQPILFNYLRGENNAPALLFHMRDEGVKSSMVLTFHEVLKRTELHMLLNGSFVSTKQWSSEEITLQSFSIALLGAESSSKLTLAPGVSWHHVRVIQEQDTTEDPDEASSDQLRIAMTSNLGTVTEHINIAPGELQIGLDTKERSVLKILHPARGTMTVSFAENLMGPEGPRNLTKTMEEAASTSTSHSYNFPRIQGISSQSPSPVQGSVDLGIDLHQFQELLTGFSVTYDE